MAKIISYLGYNPSMAEGCFVAPGAVLIGRVSLGANSSVFYNSVLRADINSIEIGKDTNIQDNCTFHLSDEYGVKVGDGVTVGHGVILHACTIGNNTLVGMGAIVMDGAVIGEDSIVAAGALVPPGKTYPPKSLLKGSPAKVIRECSLAEIAANQKMALKYLRVKEAHLSEMS